jgi:hypothetical protein
MTLLVRIGLPCQRTRKFSKKQSVHVEAQGLIELIASLLVLPDELQDRAVSMPLVWFLMNKKLATPFTVGVTVTDFQLHLALIVAVRDVSFLTYRSQTDWLAAQFVIGFITLYQVVRKCSEVFVLYRISPGVARRYCINFWNILDLSGIIGAMLTVAVVTNNDDGDFSR